MKWLVKTFWFFAEAAVVLLLMTAIAYSITRPSL